MRANLKQAPHETTHILWYVCLVHHTAHYIGYSKHGYDLVFISKQVWAPQVKYGLVSRPMPSFPSWARETESWVKTLKQGHHIHGVNSRSNTREAKIMNGYHVKKRLWVSYQ